VSDGPVRHRFFAGTTAEDLMAFMAPFVARIGYKFNTDTEFVNITLEAELGILDQTGDLYCPCRVRIGDPKVDATIVCPCISFHLHEFAAMNKCWCGLFVRTGVEDGAELHGIIEAPPGPVAVRVAAVDDLRNGEARHVKIGKRDIALFRVEGDYHALSNVCRHAFAPLAEGYLDGHVVMCPWHGWRYDVRDGTTDHPGSDVRVYPVTVSDGEVFVTVDV
jgi:nitrite reductase/ring-hydroxylating ferredoxin subunit/ferredoxin-thioredoxin reductase catalytic subunit